MPRTVRPSSVLLVAVAILAIAACGSDDDEASAPAQAPTTAAAPTPTTTQPAAEAIEKPDTRAAVDAVRNGLPDIPLYEGARLKGSVISDTEVCVDMTVSKESRELVGGNRTSHVVVSFPGLRKGETLEGSCANRGQTADKANEAAKRFYLRMDDDAIALDDAVKAAQSGGADAVGRIAQLRARILKRVNAYLLRGGDASIGANLLLSAATTAREAAEAGNMARLADQRREIADARSKLAEEALK